MNTLINYAWHVFAMCICNVGLFMHCHDEAEQHHQKPAHPQGQAEPYAYHLSPLSPSPFSPSLPRRILGQLAADAGQEVRVEQPCFYQCGLHLVAMVYTASPKTRLSERLPEYEATCDAWQECHQPQAMKEACRRHISVTDEFRLTDPTPYNNGSNL